MNLPKIFPALVLVLLSILSPPFVSAGLDPEKSQLIDQLIEEYFIPDNHVTGLGLTIVENNLSTIISKGYGYANIEQGTRLSSATLFSIGSITKSFGATIVVKVLSEKFGSLGESVLDTPIRELAPTLNFTLSDRYRAEHATFRDLLSHRSCLNSPDLDLLFGTVTRAEYSFRTRYQTEVCTFRNGYQYNNAMLALVGEIIAHIENSSIEQMVMDFMRSIGMTQSTYFDSDESYLDNPHMPSSYYRKDNQTHRFNDTLLRRVHIGLIAGGVLSSSTDMAQYINFHLNKGRYGNVQVIPENVMSWLYKLSNPIDAISGKMAEDDEVNGQYGYGLGLDLLIYNGYKVVSHGGYWPPFHSSLTFVPARRTGIFTSTNGPGAIWGLTGSGLTHEALHTAIYDILAGTLNHLSRTSLEKYGKLSSSIGSSELERQTSKSNPEEKLHLKELAKQNGVKTNVAPEELVGLYGNANSGDMNITMVDGSLHMTFGEWGIGKLTPVNNSETSFAVELTTDLNQHYYTYGDLLPIPDLQLDFSINNALVFIMEPELSFTFIRNRTLDEEPVIPWPIDSCGPLDVFLLTQ